MTANQPHNTTHVTTSSDVDVDAVVREVLRRLHSNRPVTSVAKVPSAGADPRPVESHSLRLSQPVVTLADIGDRLHSAQWLIVPSGAVVTPAVRDVLREKNIALRHADAETIDADHAIASLVVATAATAFRASGLVQTLGTGGTKIEAIEATELSDAVPRLLAAVGEHDRLGVLITDQGALAACMANRDGRARAAVVRSPEDVTQVVESLGANVLIVEPQTSGMYALRSMVARFIRTTSRLCPPELANQNSPAARCTCSSAK